MSDKQKRKWTPEEVETEVRSIAETLGHFPSNTELKKMGRNDLAVQISRRAGGFLGCAQDLNLKRQLSDSDKGWKGEEEAARRLGELGFHISQRTTVKCPFDLLIDDLLRVDVKSARRARYGNCEGWFYRIAKVPQADLILLWQLDTKDFFALPWFVCPQTNVTISPSGGKYVLFRNNVEVIKEMLNLRRLERERLGMCA